MTTNEDIAELLDISEEIDQYQTFLQIVGRNIDRLVERINLRETEQRPLTPSEVEERVVLSKQRITLTLSTSPFSDLGHGQAIVLEQLTTTIFEEILKGSQEEKTATILKERLQKASEGIIKVIRQTRTAAIRQQNENITVYLQNE